MTSTLPDWSVGTPLLTGLRPRDPAAPPAHRLAAGTTVFAGPDATAWALETGWHMALDLRLPKRFGETISLWAVVRLSGVHVIPTFLMRELTPLVHGAVAHGLSSGAVLGHLKRAEAWLGHALPAGDQFSRELAAGMTTLGRAITYEFIVQEARG
ncbi:hypothetical protein KIPE111705_00575 [Kibdelosporangium persicum]|uniref:DUF2877 domain-containing protein n=1 Tax=Kibdelosporangium persicum TaxID=2698649 RepID=A0ABX2F9U8_9PSEU|nr:hypothetical protein [Kibdelosporangium persicum]NRN67667.1 hypothetical protein [Kibdelosporangium persicum]